MKKNWKVCLYTFDEKLIETVRYRDITRDEANKFAKEAALHRKAHTYSLEEEKSMWIKAKIAVVLGINNQYAGMCLVNNQKELDKIKEEYDFPYIIEVIEDIPSLDDFLKSRKA
jgi:site-specific DNA-adenine methylase